MPPESHARSAPRKTPAPERKAYHMIAELLELVPAKHHAKARRLAEELFRHGGDIARDIYAEEGAE